MNCEDKCKTQKFILSPRIYRQRKLDLVGEGGTINLSVWERAVNLGGVRGSKHTTEFSKS